MDRDGLGVAVNEMNDSEVMTAPGAPPAELSDDQVMSPEPGVSSSAMPAVKSAVEPVLNAMGQGFREGWGPDRLGLPDDDVKWLSKVGLFAPEGSKHYDNPFHAFNELLAQTIWSTGEILARGSSGIFRAGQAAVAETGEQLGQPQLGRDLAAIPEAFFGSPHPTGMARRPTGADFIKHAESLPGVPRVTVSLDRARDLGVIGPERPSITEGTPAQAARNAVPGVTAYHGSPYSFDAFDTGKIGTGEGAQSYGHGLYFAENPEVASTYKDAYVPYRQNVDAGKYGLDPKDADRISADFTNFRMKQPADAIADEIASRKEAPREGANALALDILEGPNPEGTSYQVRIHANPEHMLDWDKPLKEQSPEVKAAIKRSGLQPDMEQTGEQFMRGLREEGDDSENARVLRDAGIPGIRYLDEGSRNAKLALERSHAPGDLVAPEPTRNFVIFDHSDVEITHKNGQPVEQPQQRAAAAQRKPDEKLTQEVGGTASDKAGNIRLDLLTDSASPDALNVIRQVAEESGGPDAFMPARQGEIPLAQVDALSQATGMAVADMDVRGIGRLLRNDNEVRIAIQSMIQSAEETSAAMKKAALTDAPEDLIEFQRLRMRHSVLQEQVAGLTAEWGRTGNVFQEFSERAKDAKGLGEFLKDKKGETIDDLREMAKAGSVLDREQMAKFLNDARRVPPGKIYWTWVNGLISGLITHTKYVAANATYAATERGIITPIASLIGKAKELGGIDADRVFFGETAASGWGMISATPTALMATAKSMKAGMRAPLQSEIALRDAAIARGEKVPASVDRAINQVTQMQRPISGIWGRIIGAPGDMAMGIHTFFKIIGERAGIEEEAYRATVKEGHSMVSDPDAFTQRWQQHAANPTEPMMERALEGAYKGTFMGELGPHGRRWQQFTKQTPGLKWLFPFSHIPVNLMKATYEYTPFAFLDSGMRDNITGKNGGIAQDKAISRMVVGSAVMGYLTNLQMTGRATGDYPQDPKERSAWKLQGKQPNSVLINGYWVSYDKFGPAGSLANIGANIGAVVSHLKSEDDDAMTKATWHAADAAAHIIVNEVGFMSLQMMFEAIHDEKKGAAWAASTASSFIPFSSANSQTASVMDPYMREAKTFADGLKYRIPAHGIPGVIGGREDLLPKRDWSGTPIANPQYGNIIRQRQVNLDPVDHELDSLAIYPAPPENRIGGVKLTPKLYDEFQSTAGPFTRQALESMVTHPGWHDLPPYIRENTIKATIKTTRAAAAAAMQAAHPEIIRQGMEDRINHMTGQKVSGKLKEPAQ